MVNQYAKNADKGVKMPIHSNCQNHRATKLGRRAGQLSAIENAVNASSPAIKLRPTTISSGKLEGKLISAPSNPAHPSVTPNRSQRTGLIAICSATELVRLTSDRPARNLGNFSLHASARFNGTSISLHVSPIAVKRCSTSEGMSRPETNA